MLKLYLISVIIWLIILLATNYITQIVCKGNNIDYSKYTKKTKGEKINLILVSLIPAFRLLYWGTMIFLMGADEEQLDKLFNKKEN